MCRVCLRLRVRRGWPIGMTPPSDYVDLLPSHADASLPPPALLQSQHEWLAPSRARLLRKARIAHRRRVLDLGCGYGLTLAELSRRCSGETFALDRSTTALGAVMSAHRVCGDVARLPFRDGQLDLVFMQNVLMWVDGLRPALNETHRVLDANGALVLLEPDFGGMMEWPEEGVSRDIWMSTLRRAGGDPTVGRKLPGLLRETGFRVEVSLLDSLRPPHERRWDLLSGLPLTQEEKRQVRQLKQQEMSVVHLPYFLIVAGKP